MEIKPQDIVVLTDLATTHLPKGFASFKDNSLSTRAISARLGLSLGAVSQSYSRLRTLGLIVPDMRATNAMYRANKDGMCEFFIHGVKYYSHPEVVGVGRGMATGWSAAPLLGNSEMIPPETPFVWPNSSGRERGEQITPIHPSAVNLSAVNKDAYTILALLDVLRVGKYREQSLAKHMLQGLLIGPANDKEF